MYHVLDKILKELPTLDPAPFSATYPRRILPPNGYLNPKYFSVTLWNSLKIWSDTDMRMLPHITCFTNALIHIQHRVPTYFVRSEFAQVVAQTDLPVDFKLSELVWPLPAMLFVLPTEFVRRYFGYLCPFISVTKVPQGILPKVLTGLPKDVPFEKYENIDNKAERLNIVYPVFSDDGLPTDYTGSYPLDINFDDIKTARFEDATYLEEAQLTKLELSNHYDRESTPTGEEEQKFTLKVQSFALQLLVILSACQNVITNGTLARPVSFKKGVRVREELWNPNLIGWNYRAQRSETTGEKGTHASPRLHWRRGHVRNQPFGPKPWTAETPKRLKWIEPVLVNAPQ